MDNKPYDPRNVLPSYWLKFLNPLLICRVYGNDIFVFYRLDHIPPQSTYEACNKTGELHLIGDFSSDAQFFVATGVLSFLYCILIAVVYVMFDAMYQSNGLLPLAVSVLL